MIKGHEIFKCIDPKAKYIAKNFNGDVYWYSSEIKPIFGYWVIGADKDYGYLGEMQIEEFEGKDWYECILERTRQNEYIGFLCYFWDCEDSEIYTISILKRIVEGDEYKYMTVSDEQYRYCRPVKKSEVKFFEDKE